MKKGFTLIELLVVIAIIAILAAILFPVFAQAKAAAKKTQSLSNLKNIQLGVILYTNDNDDILPMNQWYSPVIHLGWNDVVNPYIKSGQIWNGNDVSGVNAGIWHSPGDPTDQPSTSYAENGMLSQDGALPWNSPAYSVGQYSGTFSTSQIDGVADKIYLIERGVNAGAFHDGGFTPFEWDWVDTVGYDYNTGEATKSPGDYICLHTGKGDCDYPYNPSAGWDGSGANGCDMLPRYRFNRATPVAFLDGHARSYTRSDKSTQIDWFKNIYAKETVLDPSWKTWYPY